MAIVTLGIDLAKNVFALHGVNEAGKPVLLKPQVPRAKLTKLIAALPPCLIGLEACAGPHQWEREFQRFGHNVRLIVPRFVTPYRLSGERGKNDAADAAATRFRVIPTARSVLQSCFAAAGWTQVKRTWPSPET